MDREYVYLAKTFDAVGDRESFVAAARAALRPAWDELFRGGAVLSVEVLAKVGDIDLQTARKPVRDWAYVALLELAPGVDWRDVAAAEQAAGITAPELAARGVEYLSDEIYVRPAGAGTAVPRPSKRWTTYPPGQSAGVEYIDIPADRWTHYQDFMRRVMGPVGARLVDAGHSYRIQILERAAVLHRDASLPTWNRIHVLWGEFENPDTGFFRHTTEAVRSVLDRGLDLQGALAAVAGYRVKPRMSRSLPVLPLCLGSTAHD